MSDHLTSHHTGESIDILLIEDDRGDIRLIQEAFEITESTLSIHPVTSGEDAIAFLRQHAAERSRSLPDLVLLDLDLAGDDAYAVLEAIRNDHLLALLPVLMLTSSEDSEDVQRCHNVTANAYLKKPDDPGEFVSVVNALEEFWFERVQLPPISQ